MKDKQQRLFMFGNICFAKKKPYSVNLTNLLSLNIPSEKMKGIADQLYIINKAICRQID